MYPGRSDDLANKRLQERRGRTASPGSELGDGGDDAGEGNRELASAPRISFAGARVGPWRPGREGVGAGVASDRPFPRLKEDTLTLSGWVASHGRREGRPMEIAEWRKYLEQSVGLLRSLVTNIGGEKGGSREDGTVGDEDMCIHPKLIAAKNVVVYELKFAGEAETTADFIDRDDSALLDGGEGGTAKEYRAMDALGRLAYGMLISGDEQGVSKLCPRSNVAAGNFLDALRIRGDEEAAPDEGEIIETLRKNPRTSRSEGGDSSGVISAMLHANVPFPLCRFVSDLLDDGGGMLGRSENSFSSFADVLSDLAQMGDNPDAFLHASSPERWKLAFGDKLYGRGKATQVFMDVADRVATTRDDPLFSELSEIKGKRTEVIMVSGFGGVGKSRLVELAGASLGKRGGWRFLCCKFDRVVSLKPLSILASAFDRCIASLAVNDTFLLSTHADISCTVSQEIRERLKKIIGLEGLGILARHVPSLHQLLRVPILPEGMAKPMAKPMLHSLFGKLLRALSIERAPILFFTDDLQWADPLSLEMISALIRGVRPDRLHLSHGNDKKKSPADPEEDVGVMFVGSYRDNEVDDDHLLTKVLRKFHSDSSINVTNVSLLGFTPDALNEMLSESLSMPVRRVRSLSRLVLQKTDGHPLHVVEFLQALATDNLMTHSFVRGWEWDEDAIDIFPITDSVAELFAFKLRKLPRDILRGIQILSCFGSQIDRHVLRFMGDYDREGSVDVAAAIDAALREGLVEQAANLVSFSHDIIQKAAMESIDEDEFVPLLLKLVLALAKNASAANDLDSILFYAVDLLNRIGSDAVSSPRERALFANLNSRAASKSIAVPDFASAAKYAENGIAFLTDTHWETQYDLSLGLYEAAVLSHFSSPEAIEDRLKDRINAIFINGRDFPDKFNTHCVWIKLLATKDLSKAIEESLNALRMLGEPLDLANVDYGTVLGEVVKYRERYKGERKKEFLSRRRMTDCNKAKAMKVMLSLAMFYERQQSFLAYFVVCQMIGMSKYCGHSEGSIFGAAFLAADMVIILEDVEEGCSWARLALSLMEIYDKDNMLVPFAIPSLYGRVFCWKEPLQSTLEPLARGVRLSFTTGNAMYVNINSSIYLYWSLNCGKNIGVLNGEVKALAHQYMIQFGDDGTSGSIKNQKNQIIPFIMAPLYNTLCYLEGGRELNEGVESSFCVGQMRLMDNYNLLKATLEKGQVLAHLTILSYQTLKALLFRDMDDGLEYSEMFAKNFKIKMDLNHFTNMFYGALIAFYFARETGEERHRVRATTAMRKLKEWSVHSEWNLKNKLLLMEAESLYTRKEFHEAAACYEASIKAAQEHRFLHEEALASELAAIFLFTRGLLRESYILFKKSIACYDKWGAHAVVRRIQDSIENKFDPDLIDSVDILAESTIESKGLPSKKR